MSRLDEIEKFCKVQREMSANELFINEMIFMARLIRELAGCAKVLEAMATVMENQGMLENTARSIRDAGISKNVCCPVLLSPCNVGLTEDMTASLTRGK